MMNVPDKRPEWPYDLSEAEVRLLNNTIIKITHHSEIYSADQSRDWIEFHTAKSKFKAPNGWEKFYRFAPNWASLIVTTYEGSEALKRLREIETWERNNNEDRLLYERLKEKFGTT